MQWNSEILEEAKFPVAMLPKVMTFKYLKWQDICGRLLTSDHDFLTRWSDPRSPRAGSPETGLTFPQVTRTTEARVTCHVSCADCSK